MVGDYDELDREKWQELLTANHERVCHGQCPGPRNCKTAFIAAILDENAALQAELKATIDFVESARPGEFHFGAAKALLGDAS